MITVGFSTTNNMVSKIIRWVTRSNRFSHTWIRYDHFQYQMSIIVQAEAIGIVEVPYDVYSKRMLNLVELLPPDGLSLTKGLPTLGSTLGHGYDYLSVIGQVWVYFWGWLGKKVKNPFKDPTRDACIENVIVFLRAAGVLTSDDIDESTASPESLYRLLCSRGWQPLPPMKDQRGLHVKEAVKGIAGN